MNRAKNKNTANYGPFPVTGGRASARIQGLKQKAASGLSGKKQTPGTRSELEALKKPYPRA